MRRVVDKDGGMMRRQVGKWVGKADRRLVEREVDETVGWPGRELDGGLDGGLDDGLDGCLDGSLGHSVAGCCRCCRAACRGCCSGWVRRWGWMVGLDGRLGWRLMGWWRGWRGWRDSELAEMWAGTQLV
jgi:hypothetical protein